MKKIITIILACVLVSGVLVGCDEKPSKTVSSEKVRVTSSSSQASETISNQLTFDPTQEPPIDDYAAKMPVPDFLDSEQQNLYRRASMIYSILNGNPARLEDNFLLLDGSRLTAETKYIELDGESYTVAQGRYKNWNDFEAMLHHIFTQEYSKYLINWGSDYDNLINVGGTLHFVRMGRGGAFGHIGDDSFELISKKDDEIKFYVIGHYIEPHEDETDEEYMRRKDSGNFDRTEKFPITMVKTDNGWRVSEFNITV